MDILPAQGIFRKGTVMQEAVHNLNIYHGWKDGREYRDYSTSMGYGESCPSAPELWRLGWATLLDQLNTTSFPDQTFRTYTLPATCLGPNKNMIKIQPNWLGSSYTRWAGRTRTPYLTETSGVWEAQPKQQWSRQAAGRCGDGSLVPAHGRASTMRQSLGEAWSAWRAYMEPHPTPPAKPDPHPHPHPLPATRPPPLAAGTCTWRCGPSAAGTRAC